MRVEGFSVQVEDLGIWCCGLGVGFGGPVYGVSIFRGLVLWVRDWVWRLLVEGFRFQVCGVGFRVESKSQGKRSGFKIWSRAKACGFRFASEVGSYVKLKIFLYLSSLGSRVTKTKQKVQV